MRFDCALAQQLRRFLLFDGRYHSSLSQLGDNPQEALREYYSLTSEEVAALASGDIRKIESWVGKLDENLATWLWARLAQEKW